MGAHAGVDEAAGTAALSGGAALAEIRPMSPLKDELKVLMSFTIERRSQRQTK